MKNIKKRLIERLTKGMMKVFHIDEVKDLGTLHYLMTTIYELKKEGYLVKLSPDGQFYEFRGINYHVGIKCKATALDVARLLKRKYKWQMVPARDYAMSLFGLGYECEEYCFVSDKKDLRVEFNDTVLIVEHKDRTYFTQYSFNTILVIEVLKGIGMRDITEEQLRIISSKLTRKEKQIMYQEVKFGKYFKEKENFLFICRI